MQNSKLFPEFWKVTKKATEEGVNILEGVPHSEVGAVMRTVHREDGTPKLITGFYPHYDILVLDCYQGEGKVFPIMMLCEKGKPVVMEASNLAEWDAWITELDSRVPSAEGWQ